MKLKSNPLKDYFKPTPKLLWKIGDSLLAVSLFITGYAVIMENKTLAIIFIIIGAIGKFGTNLFK